MTNQPQPPAGWYSVGSEERWWDGAAWTDRVRPQAPQQVPLPPPPLPQLAGPPPDGATYGLVTNEYGLVPAVHVAPKNPAISLLASFFVPGLGSLLNGDVAKAIAIFVGYVISWMLTVVLIGFVGLFGFWIWGMVDAYQGAQRWNARRGILS